MAADQRGFWKTYFWPSYGDAPVQDLAGYQKFINRKDKKSSKIFHYSPLYPIILVVIYASVFAVLEHQNARLFEWLVETLNPETLHLDSPFFYFSNIREHLIEVRSLSRIDVVLHLVTVMSGAYFYFAVYVVLFIRIYNYTLLRRFVEEARYRATSLRTRFWALVIMLPLCFEFFRGYEYGSGRRFAPTAHLSTKFFILDALILGTALWGATYALIGGIVFLRLFFKYRRFQYHIPIRARLDRVRARMNSKGTTHG